MYEFLSVVFFIISVILIMLIILQQSRTHRMGTFFRSENSRLFFSLSKSGNIINRITTFLAILFFCISLALNNINSNNTNQGSEWENLTTPLNVEKQNHSISTLEKLTNDIPK